MSPVPSSVFLIMDYAIRKTMCRAEFGIPWSTDKRLTDLDFADDIALLAKSSSVLQDMTSSLEENASTVRLKISSQKTKVMQFGGTETNTQLTTDKEPIENVSKFTYLGSVFTSDGDVEADINCRIGKASAVFRRMQSVWTNSEISRALKVRLIQSIVLSTTLYACETWKISAKMKKKLDAFQQRCLRRVLKITFRDRVTNAEIYERTDTRQLSQMIAERRMKYAGHVMRIATERLPHTAINWKPEGRRKRGRPRLTWRRTFLKDLEERNIDPDEAKAIAQDRGKWRQLAAQCTYKCRRT